MRWGIVLAGGEGSRFWPLSTPESPKQLLPLVDGGSTLSLTVSHLLAILPRERILLVTSPAVARSVSGMVDLPPENILAEPRPASTAPALAWGTAEAYRRDREATVVSVHSDWVVPDREPFCRALEAALDGAERLDRLLTVGLKATRPDPGFGYILPADSLPGGGKSIGRFTEKPSIPEAQSLIERGALWNSGLFAWGASRFLEEVAEHAPELAPHLEALNAGEVGRFFSEVTPIAIDHALFERSPNTAVIEAEFAWDDVGTWEALFRVRARNGDGNILIGPSHPTDVADSLLWSDGPPIVAAGVAGIIVVAAHGRILVLPRGRSDSIKEILARLPDAVRRLS